MVNVNNYEELCNDAVNDILSQGILNPEKINTISQKYIDLYNAVDYTPSGEIGRFFDLFLPILDLAGFIQNLHLAHSALNEYNNLTELTDDQLIKWLVKYEDDGLYLSTINFRTKLDNIDEIPDGYVLLHNNYGVKVEVAPFLPILNLVSIFDDHYYKTIDKYRTELDDETYYENLREYYKSNNRQKKLIEFVGHIINPPIEDVFTVNDKPLDLNKLKRYVPMRIEYYSMSSSSDKTLQDAHDLFHQDEIEKARDLYKDFVQSRNDSQEAWLGLTICNYILGDYENAYIACSNLYLWRYRDLINYIEKYRKDTDVNENEYYITDKTCEDSIQDLNERTDVTNWLEENKSLFKSISIKPKGFPSVANCHFSGKYYKNISEFHRLYEKTEFEEIILETKTHFEAIVYFIETMNSRKIDQLLTNDKFDQKDKSKIIIYLIGAFISYKKGGDSRLFSHEGVCYGCKYGCKGYTFIGDKTRNYTDLVFITKDNFVTDIIDCSSFKNESITRNILGENIKFDPNDIPF